MNHLGVNQTRAREQTNLRRILDHIGSFDTVVTVVGSNHQSLLTRLASYSQNPAKKSLENFTTEVLTYLIENDPKFQRIFIRQIIPDGRIRRRFKQASAESQQSFGNGIVDLVLSSNDSMVLVEVKIAAAETETKIYGKGWVSQVQKYLDFNEGPVAYLTTRAVSAPDLRSKAPKRFLGHSFFEDLYDDLVSHKDKLGDWGHLFLKFMEENHMKSLDPFTASELDNAMHSFNFAKKCEAFLNEIRPRVELEFQEIFRSRRRFTRGHFSPTYGSAYIWIVGGLSKYKDVKSLSVCIEPHNGSLDYGVCVKVLRTGIKRLNRLLKWTEVDGYLISYHPVTPKTKSGTCVRTLHSDLKTLKNALKQI